MCNRFFPATVQHVYQGTVDGVLVFYSLQDVLVFFSIFMTLAGEYEVPILTLSLMPDHYHCVLVAQDKKEIASMLKRITRLYTKGYNARYERHGLLFRQPFGCAAKKGTKAIISTINYSLNNQAVKKLCSRVEQTRLNFLAYSLSNHPFSEIVNKAKVSRRLRRALKEVETCAEDGTPLNYVQLDRILGTLDKTEREQFADRAIVAYNRIDYETAGAYYGSIAEMIMAANSNSGSEYALTETFDTNDDRPYGAIHKTLASFGALPLTDILRKDLPTRLEIGWRVMKECPECPSRHIEKFLQLPDGTLHKRMPQRVKVRQHYRRSAAGTQPVDIQ